MAELMETKSEFYSFDTDKCGNGGIGLAIHYPQKRNDKSEIGIIAMHGTSYMNFTPMVNMAKYGYIAAGIMPKGRNVDHLMHAMDTCLNFLREKTGVKKVILMAHSQGGCILSLYQYLAENGPARFERQDRFLPFPKIGKLTPADGIIEMDGNYGIMSMLAMDPAVRLSGSGWARIPELDIFDPANGYRPGGSEYSADFIRAFQKAQLQQYRDLLDYCKERYELIRRGRGRFADDEPLVIPGAKGGSNNNKPFCMDTRLLSRTSRERDLLHSDGSITHEIVHTTRKPEDSVHSNRYNGGAASTTVLSFLKEEMRFSDDFGYNDRTIWGIDEDFVFYSTRENFKYIHVPVLFQGNSASHEFINMEISYENAASPDKTYIASEGSNHDYSPVDPRYEGILDRVCDYFDVWLSRPGRFL